MQIEEKIPEPTEYCSLRVICGLSAMSLEAATLGLPKSLYAVTLRKNEKLIGMGRVVGDGLHVQVVDIAVDPEFQGQGYSRQIMERIMSFIDEKVPKCAVVSLFADVDWLYEKFGFVKPQKSQGMFYKRNF